MLARCWVALNRDYKGASGIFNIAEPNGHVAMDKARTVLGWHVDFRLPVGSPATSSRVADSTGGTTWR
jgi:hypothetical protein